MPSRIERSEASLRDLEELIDFLRGRNPEVAQRFAAATDTTFRFLAENRQVGQLCDFANHQLAGMRVCRIESFRNYVVYFRPTRDGVEIIRVLHGARDLGAIFGDEASA